MQQSKSRDTSNCAFSVSRGAAFLHVDIVYLYDLVSPIILADLAMEEDRAEICGFASFLDWKSLGGRGGFAKDCSL